MKISYRNHPLLKKLQDGKIGLLGVLEEDESFFRSTGFAKAVGKMFNKAIPYFKNDIKIFSKTFSDACLKAKDKLLTPELIMSVKNVSGTIVDGRATFFYFTEDGSDGDDWILGYFAFLDDYLVSVGYNDSINKKSLHWASELYHKGPKNHVAYSETNQMFIAQLMLKLNFIKYADIEVKNLPAKSKIKDHHCKYVNDTDSNIQIMDCTWFTTLVQSNAFKVRGHFRLQACGEGMKERKLIWVNDFEKQGYTRHFKRPINTD